MTNPNQCKGCVDYDKNCLIVDRAPCPCVQCLVKPMCDNTCEPFNELVNHLKFEVYKGLKE